MEISSLRVPAAPPQVVALDQKVFAYAGDNARGVHFAKHADGVVFRNRAGFTAARSCTPDATCIVDPEHYAKDRNDRAQISLIPETPTESVLAQVHAGAACLLSPARFPADRGGQGIKCLLNDGEAFIDAARDEAPSLPAFVVVVIRYDELADGRWIQPIRTSGLPIATVFAAYADPLAQPAALEGAIRVIEAAEAAFVLRCDMSVAGPNGTASNHRCDRHQLGHASLVAGEPQEPRRKRFSQRVRTSRCKLDEAVLRRTSNSRPRPRRALPLCLHGLWASG